MGNTGDLTPLITRLPTDPPWRTPLEALLSPRIIEDDYLGLILIYFIYGIFVFGCFSKRREDAPVGSITANT